MINENIKSCINGCISCWMCANTQSLKLCVTCVVWPVVHLCSVGASHTSHLLILFDSNCDYKQWGARPHFLLCCQVVHGPVSETDDHCPHQRAPTSAGGNVCFSHVNCIWMRGLPVLLFIVSTTVSGNHQCIIQRSYTLFQFDVLYSPR